MAVRNNKVISYGLGSPIVEGAPTPIIAQRAPTNADKAEIGSLWVDQAGNDVHCLVEVVAGVSGWVPVGAGSPIMDALTINPGNLTVTAGTITASAMAAAGVVFNSAAGLFTTGTGTDGQVIIGATGAAPLFATVVSGDGSMSVAVGANTLDLRVTGAAASTFPTDAGLATPVLGATTIAGGTNVNTAGAGGTVTVNVDNAPTFAGLVTAQAGFSQTAGTATITSDTNGGRAIYLHADGGAAETVEIHADQGTAVDTIYVHADVGGYTLDSGLASADAINIVASDAAGGIDVDCGTGGINIAAANGPVTIISGTGAVGIANDATDHTTTVGSVTGVSAITVQAGTGALTVNGGGDVLIDAVDVLELNSSAGIISIGNDAVAQNINLGTGAAARIITIGNVTAASQVVINSGTAGIALASTGAGDITVDSDDTLLLDADGVLELNSSAGIIGIGSDADAFGINIGTGAAARDIVVGNATGATSFTLNAGTGAVLLASNGTVHDTTVGSAAGASATTLQAGTGALTLTAGGICDVNGTGNITIDSTGGTLGMGEGADANNINIGTGAAARVITIGNDTGATSVIVDCGTGGAEFGTILNNHTTTIGTTNGTADTVINSGTGGITLTSGGLFDPTPDTDTKASPAAATAAMNVNVGVATFTGFGTIPTGTQGFTITNALISATSGILVTVANLGGQDARMEIQRVTPGAGSAVVDVINNGTQNLNGNCIVSFWVLN